MTTASYRYDGVGRRIEKDAGGAITRYIYDREDIVLEYDGLNNLLARYTHGPGIDEPLVMERDLDASGTFEATERFFYHADGLGSVTELTDSAGVVARAYAYDSYGQIVDEVGTLANPFTYTAREFDAESGLYFYRARYYDPETGRFTQQDPIGFAGLDVNLYRYVFNNPTNLTDPSGLFAPVVAGAIAGFVGGYITSGTLQGAAIGAVGGAFAVVALSSTAGAFVLNAAASGIGQLIGIGVNYSQGLPSNDFSIGAALGAGAVGAFGNALVKPLLSSNIGLQALGALIEGGFATLGTLIGEWLENNLTSSAFAGTASGKPAC